MYGGDSLSASRQLARERAGRKRDDETDEQYAERLAEKRPGRNALRPVTNAERRGEFRRQA